jgi:hypothetical protein
MEIISQRTEVTSQPSIVTTVNSGVQTIEVSGLSNQEFFEAYASPGRIGLTGGIALVDRAITRAQSRVDASRICGKWSHAFLFQGRRHDGHHWLIESNMELHRKHIRLGAQENRVSKFCNEQGYCNVAVLDFNLTEQQITSLLSEGLNLVANHAGYSVRELFGTLIALHDPKMRAEKNPLARESSMYCSAFVQHLFRKSGIELAPGVHPKNTTPEDISRTLVPHVRYVLKRELPATRLEQLGKKLKTRVRGRIARLKERVK